MSIIDDMLSKEFNLGLKAGLEKSAKEIEELKRRVRILELKDMPLHPLHTRKWIEAFLDNGYSLDEITSRQTGRSTVQALRNIAWLIENPGKVLKVEDHFGTTAASRNLLAMMRQMVMDMELKHIHFNRSDNTAIFENRERKA